MFVCLFVRTRSAALRASDCSASPRNVRPCVSALSTSATTSSAVVSQAAKWFLLRDRWEQPFLLCNRRLPCLPALPSCTTCYLLDPDKCLPMLGLLDPHDLLSYREFLVQMFPSCHTSCSANAPSTCLCCVITSHRIWKCNWLVQRFILLLDWR